MKALFLGYVRSFPMVYVAILWIIEISEQLSPNGFGKLGTHPRHFNEWYTAFTGALVHGDWDHLIHNSYPLLILGFFILLLYPRNQWFIYWLSFVATGIAVWLFARSNVYHVGASGVVYAWAAFLAFTGFFRGDRLALAIGLAVAFLYGGLIWGVLPIKPGISWDGHLIGGLVGFGMAWLFRNTEKRREKTADDLDDSFEYEQYDYSGYEYLKRKKIL